MRHLWMPHHFSKRNILSQHAVSLTLLANNLLRCMSGPFHIHPLNPILTGLLASKEVDLFQGVRTNGEYRDTDPRTIKSCSP